MESYLFHPFYRKTLVVKLSEEFFLAVQMVETRNIQVVLPPADIDITELSGSNKKLL
jgi:hypothetical protein